MYYIAFVLVVCSLSLPLFYSATLKNTIASNVLDNQVLAESQQRTSNGPSPNSFPSHSSYPTIGVENIIQVRHNAELNNCGNIFGSKVAHVAGIKFECLNSVASLSYGIPDSYQAHNAAIRTKLLSHDNSDV